jgi:fibronectin type III domain protein
MTRRWMIIAVALQGLTLSCDSSSPAGSGTRALPTGPLNTVTPIGLTAKAVAWNEIDLSWPRASNAATGYEIFRSITGVTGTYSLLSSVGSSVTTYADGGRSGSTQYCYEVRSYKIAGKNTQYSTFSGSACATTPAPPVSAPSQADAVPTGSSSISLSWVDNSSNEDGFRIERADATGGPWTQVGTATANVTAISQPVTAEHVSCFRVIAFNAAGPSSPSNTDCTTSPAAPTNLTLKNPGQLSVQLAWQDNSSVEDGYIVSRLDPTGWGSVAKLAANATGFTDRGGAAGHKYVYRVQATKDGGYSDFSNELTVTLPDAEQVIPPAAPVDFSAHYFADNEYGWLYFYAIWSNASGTEDGFRVEVSGDGVTDWQTYGTADANSTSFQVKLSLWDNLVPISQCFRAIAFIGKVNSEPSKVSCTDWNKPPTNLTATAVDGQSIDLSWADNASYELGYFIYRSTLVDRDYEFVASVPANTTAYRDSGLASGQEYWYFVIVYRDENVGGDAFDYSDRVSATTLTGAVDAGAPGVTSVVTVPSKIVKRSLRGRPLVRNLPKRK